MQTIYVRLILPNGDQIPCGEILCEDPDGRGRVDGVFRYSREYPNHPMAFALDPVSLPLTPDETRFFISQSVPICSLIVSG